MPPHKRQSADERRQQIIAGALQVFAEKGFDRASNRDIAAAAGIGSPGLIYHYFRDKEDLLHHVVRSRITYLWLLDTTSSEDGSDDNLPLEETLLRFALLSAESLNEEHNVALWQVLLAEAARNPKVAEIVNDAGPGYTLRTFAGYLAKQMAAGRLRRIDPDVAAHIFMGPLIAYMLARYVYGQAQSKAICPEAMARAVVETFLHALAVAHES